ncbi:MAG: hypothetical protein HY909_29570 [Deltaproteobacteria bacterium]|nr:hypothetical protein [Deltaproteobacteria bacterium]
MPPLDPERLARLRTRILAATAVAGSLGACPSQQDHLNRPTTEQINLPAPPPPTVNNPPVQQQAAEADAGVRAVGTINTPAPPRDSVNEPATRNPSGTLPGIPPTPPTVNNPPSRPTPNTPARPPRRPPPGNG